MNIFDELKHQINHITAQKFQTSLNQNQLSVEFPRDAQHGDLSTNVAMLLAKTLKQSPLAIAEQIKPDLERLIYIESVSIAAPGFINLKLTTDIWFETLAGIIKQDTAFGDNNLGQGEEMNIEFLSTNPTGPMHIGHSRCGIYGDALANVMSKCGYKVTKEFYVNDAGAQINTLADSTYLRYLEASGDKDIEIPEGLYPGDYLIPVGEALFQQYGVALKTMNEEARLAIIKPFAVEAMLKLIQADLARLGVVYDVFFSEATLHKENKITDIVQSLQARDLVYRGILPPPKGKIHDAWEAREQLLFRATNFGDDIDRSLQKSNGDWTYVAADIAYMKNKIDRGFKKITLVLGVDHLGYKKRMQAIAQSLGGDAIEFEIKFCQLVNFVKDGQPFKMSKRQGTFITIEDVLQEVDKDLVRFVMLTRRNDQVLDFDLEKVKEQSKDNPVFYVQYANARVNSIIKNASEQNPEYAKRIEAGAYNLQLLNRTEEIELIKLMSSWPKIVELSCIHQEPHRIAFFLIELASSFHTFWSKGNEDPSLRFIIADNFELSLARLMLAKTVSIVIASGLKIFNVIPITKM